MTCQEITRIHTSAKRKLPTEAKPKLCLIQVESQLNYDSVNHPVSLLHGTGEGAYKHSPHYIPGQHGEQTLTTPGPLLIMRKWPTLNTGENNFIIINILTYFKNNLR